MKKVLTVLLGLGLMIVAYAWWISYYRLEVTSYTLTTDKVDTPLNLVMLADLHDPNCRIRDEVLEQVQSLTPDLILCVGDMIDESADSDDQLLAFMAALKAIAPVYMSIGNHEIDFVETHEDLYWHLESAGIQVLDQDYVDVEVNGQNVRLGGLYRYAFSQYDGGIAAKNSDEAKTFHFLTEMTETDDLTVMMAHRPDSFIFGQAYRWDIDLVLSGHVHGGQIVLPYFGGLYAPDQGWFPDFDYGLFHLGQMQMIISRGLSSSEEWLPRLNNPAEIVQIKIEPES